MRLKNNVTWRLRTCHNINLGKTHVKTIRSRYIYKRFVIPINRRFIFDEFRARLFRAVKRYDFNDSVRHTYTFPVDILHSLFNSGRYKNTTVYKSRRRERQSHCVRFVKNNQVLKIAACRADGNTPRAVLFIGDRSVTE